MLTNDRYGLRMLINVYYGLVYAYSRYATPREASCHSPPEGPGRIQTTFQIHWNLIGMMFFP